MVFHFDFINYSLFLAHVLCINNSKINKWTHNLSLFSLLDDTKGQYN